MAALTNRAAVRHQRTVSAHSAVCKRTNRRQERGKSEENSLSRHGPKVPQSDRPARAKSRSAISARTYSCCELTYRDPPGQQGADILRRSGPARRSEPPQRGAETALSETARLAQEHSPRRIGTRVALVPRAFASSWRRRPDGTIPSRRAIARCCGCCTIWACAGAKRSAWTWRIWIWPPLLWLSSARGERKR